MPRKPTGEGSGGGRPMVHGLRKLETHLLGQRRMLDRRGRMAKLWKRRVLDWADDAGGMVHLSSRQQTLLWHTAAVSLMIDSIFDWSLSQPSLLDGKQELLAPLRKSLIAYLNAERRGLEALGLQPPRPEAVPTLAQYIAARSNPPARENGTPAPQSDDQPATKGEAAC